jgi:beta-lactamase superfamily II metal-dependent hydrolase
MSLFQIDMLPAREGDCLWVEYGDPARPRRILIDGGRQVAYTTLKKRIAALPPDQRQFELLILSHVDADHAEGLLHMLKDPDVPITFKDVWFNGYDHLEKPRTLEWMGAKQGEAFTRGIHAKGWKWNAAFDGKSVVIPDDGILPVKVLADGMRLTLLSPTWDKLENMEPVWKKELQKAGLLEPVAPPDSDIPDLEGFGALTVEEVEEAAASVFKPDDSEANGTSIGVLAEFDGRTAVLTGDAHADVIAASLAKLRHANGSPARVDAFKLSHHGSRGTHSIPLLAEIACSRFLISTDGSRHRHPHVESLARTVKHTGPGIEFYFNFKSVQAAAWDVERLKRRYSYQTIFPKPGEEGMARISL